MEKLKNLGLFAIVLMSQNLYANDVPDLSNLSIIESKVSGTGCVGGAGASAELINGVIVLKATNLIVQSGDGSRPSDARKSCQYIIDLNVPSGWTFGIANVTSGSKSTLPSGGTGEIKYSYYFSLPSEGSEIAYSFAKVGYSNRRFYREMDPIVYAPCDAVRALKLKQALLITTENREDVASMSMKTSKFRLNWKKCP